MAPIHHWIPTGDRQIFTADNVVLKHTTNFILPRQCGGRGRAGTATVSRLIDVPGLDASLRTARVDGPTDQYESFGYSELSPFTPTIGVGSLTPSNLPSIAVSPCTARYSSLPVSCIDDVIRWLAVATSIKIFRS